MDRFIDYNSNDVTGRDDGAIVRIHQNRFYQYWEVARWRKDKSFGIEAEGWFTERKVHATESDAVKYACEKLGLHACPKGCGHC